VELRILRQSFQGSGVQSADIDSADDPDPFQVIQRGQKEIEGNHPSAHDRYVKTYHGCGHGHTPSRLGSKAFGAKEKDIMN
jgi:hypothetical protein